MLLLKVFLMLEKPEKRKKNKPQEFKKEMKLNSKIMPSRYGPFTKSCIKNPSLGVKLVPEIRLIPIEKEE